nr:energy transducer TonB [Desulfobulbaceae bacterium]
MSIVNRNIGILAMNQGKSFAISILVHFLIIAGLIVTTSTIKPAPELMVVDFTILENYVTKTTAQEIIPAPKELKAQKKAVVVAPKTPKPISVKQKEVFVPPIPIPASKPIVAAIKQKKPSSVKTVPKSIPELIPEVLPPSAPTITEEAPQQTVHTPQPSLAPATNEKIMRKTTHTFPAPAAGKLKNKQTTDTVSAYTKTQFKHIQQSIQQLVNYPRTARRMGWEGKVVLEFIICKDGTVKDIGIVESSGFKALDKNAVNTIKKAAPFPIPPIAAKLVIPVVYRLS